MKMPSKFLLVGSIILALCACSSNPEDAIVGKWKEIGKTEVIEFFEEGTVSSTNKGISLTGKYSFIEKNRVKLEFGGVGALAGPKIRTVSIDGDVLTLTDSTGDEDKYQRIK